MKVDIITGFLIPTSKTTTFQTETTSSEDGFLNLVVMKKDSINLIGGQLMLGIAHLHPLKTLSLCWAWKQTQPDELGSWMVQWRACPRFGAKDRPMRMGDTTTDGE